MMHQQRLQLLAMACAALLFFGHVRADAPGAYLGDVKSEVLQSQVDPERSFQISVALPISYAGSNNRYPVIYALDANGEFGIAAGSPSS